MPAANKAETQRPKKTKKIKQKQKKLLTTQRTLIRTTTKTIKSYKLLATTAALKTDSLLNLIERHLLRPSPRCKKDCCAATPQVAHLLLQGDFFLTSRCGPHEKTQSPDTELNDTRRSLASGTLLIRSEIHSTKETQDFSVETRTPWISPQTTMGTDIFDA